MSTVSMDAAQRQRSTRLQAWCPSVHLCVLRAAGSDDEAAGLQERAERILYFFPRDVGLHAQLKHIGFCEGLIDFVG
jgi:hypothetical protein